MKRTKTKRMWTAVVDRARNVSLERLAAPLLIVLLARVPMAFAVCYIQSNIVSTAVSNMLSVAQTCSDSVKNNGESDVDCGGPLCSACNVGKACDKNGDCASNFCDNSVCGMLKDPFLVDPATKSYVL